MAQVRGFGDPLAASYMRSYLVHKMYEVAPFAAAELVLTPLWDSLTVFEKQLAADAPAVAKAVKRASIPLVSYFTALLPPLEWIMQCVAEQHATQEMLVQTIRQYRAQCKSALVLRTVITSFEPALISQNALAVCDLIREADDGAYPRYHLYVAFGAALCAAPPPKEEQLSILNDVWAQIATIASAAEYVAVAVQFLRFLMIEFGEAEVRETARARRPARVTARA